MTHRIMEAYDHAHLQSCTYTTMHECNDACTES